MSLFKITNLVKKYGKNGALVEALKGINIEIPKNKFIVILGESGSGKSTFLNMIGCMDKPTKGSVLFEDIDITKLSKSEMTRFRKDNIGFVFQSYNLLPDLTALGNVEFSTEIIMKSGTYAKDALRAVGLEDRMNHFPSQLSGGEQQRVSIARAIAKNPNILLCDEPTGALDFETGIKILEVLKTIQEKRNTSILLITHNKEIAKIADVVIRLRSGNVISNEVNKSPLRPSEVEW